MIVPYPRTAPYLMPLSPCSAVVFKLTECRVSIVGAILRSRKLPNCCNGQLQCKACEPGVHALNSNMANSNTLVAPVALALANSDSFTSLHVSLRFVYSLHTICTHIVWVTSDSTYVYCSSYLYQIPTDPAIGVLVPGRVEY